MHNAVFVQILNAQSQLVNNFPDSVLPQVELLELKIIKQIRASHVVKDYVVVVWVLKNIHKLYDVGMLAHLQHLYFSSLLKHLDVRHVLLLHLLYRYLFISKLVGRQLN